MKKVRLRRFYDSDFFVFVITYWFHSRFLGELVVSTTRPETMLGDTAVAVHPEDKRYKHLHGKMLKHPFVDRLIPVITDAELVDMDFGTGAVKVTPSHDPNDYQTGKRHNLPFINIMTDDGKINENGGKYAGMHRLEVRSLVIKDLDAAKLYRGRKENKVCRHCPCIWICRLTL